MSLIRKIKTRIKPGPIRVTSSVGLRRGGVRVSIKPPLLRRKTVFRRTKKWI